MIQRLFLLGGYSTLKWSCLKLLNQKKMCFLNFTFTLSLPDKFFLHAPLPQ